MSTTGLNALIGTPVSRLDGQEKARGAATYAGEWPFDNLLYGALVQSTIPRGRVLGFELEAASAAPGVARIFTHANTPHFESMHSPPLGQRYLPLQDDAIHYEGQHLALVLAETLEQAWYAAELIRVSQVPEPAAIDFAVRLEQAVQVKNFAPSDTKTGEIEGALASAAVKIENVYRTADRHHVALEPSTTIADWRDGKLTVYDTAQWVHGVRMALSHVLRIPIEDVRVISKFLGGGFGSKGFVWPHQILAAMATRELGRPVKLALTRAQSFTSHGYQCATEQHVTLASARDGRLSAIRHRAWNPTPILDDYLEYSGAPARTLYACPAIETTHRAVRVNRGNPTPMRAPHEGPGAFGLECALDELAYALALDPVELRLRNYALNDPTTGRPFSQKNLDACYRQGAERFGWQSRSPVPGTMHEGSIQIGYGMASAVMSTFRFKARARITMHPDQSVLIETSTQDIGGGQYTILPQIAAETLEVPLARVRLILGDTDLPDGGGTFGSTSTMSVGSAVYRAATKLKEMIEAAGTITAPLTAEGSFEPEKGGHSMHTFGAIFAEVHVDRDLPTPRVARLVGVYSAGKIINPKTARSQIIGGMTWGIGQALLEASELDENLGRYLNKNLSGYLVPTNADVQSLDVTFIDEIDQHASAIGAKGIGELGAVGIAPAIANAIYHATGKRIRHLPIKPEDLL